MTFWEEVAREVSKKLKESAPDMPSWEELDHAGKASMVVICIEAVKVVAKKGRAHLPAQVEDDSYKPDAG